MNDEIANARDNLLSQLWKKTPQSSPTHGLALIALGGYGRRELGWYSDLDLLLLHDATSYSDVSLKPRADALLYPLWDQRIDVSLATRTLAECEHVMRRDVRSLTSLLDARLIIGDDRLFETLRSLIASHFRQRLARRMFIDQKIEEQENRLMRHTNADSLIQPHLKEGEGGLRAIHTLQWIAMVATQHWNADAALVAIGLDKEECDEVRAALAFVWRVRTALHDIEKCRQDRFVGVHQTEVAHRMGFTEQACASAAELCLRQYYQHGANIRRISSLVEERAIERCSPWSAAHTMRRLAEAFHAQRLFSQPEEVLRLFVNIRHDEKKISATMRQRLRQSRHVISVDQWEKESCRILWDAIFSRPEHTASVVCAMQDCDHLERWLPEWNGIKSLVQHDGSHCFTVDEHTLRAMNLLSECFSTPRGTSALSDLCHDIQNPRVVCLSLLLHDIGKGRGGDHSVIGAEMARKISQRMGWTEEEAEQVSWLVLSHLLMTRLAFRRDISDQQLIERFAQSVGTVDKLRMLYLLTLCDVQSVGPGVWTPWKASLLSDLYRRCERYLLSGQHQLQEQALKISEYEQEWNQRLNNDAQISFRPLPDLNLMELTIVCPDRAGLFSIIAGVLAGHACNIVEATLSTSAKRLAVDVIRYTTDTLHREQHEALVRRDLNAAFSGELEIEHLVTRRRPAHRLPMSASRKEQRIDIDNDVSQECTVVEVHADDRPALLYDVASAISALGWSIDRAQITTHHRRVVDSFYVRGPRGLKERNARELMKLRNALEKCLFVEGGT